MTFELTMLIYAVLIFFALLVVQVLLTIMNQGLIWGVGNRDNAPEKTTLQHRIDRAVTNNVEGLALFTPVVLTAAVAGISTGMTETGALLFVLSRAAYPLVYAISIPFVRTLVWAAGAVGIVMIVLALLSGPAPV